MIITVAERFTLRLAVAVDVTLIVKGCACRAVETRTLEGYGVNRYRKFNCHSSKKSGERRYQAY